MIENTWTPVFGERWRHGGWYVTNCRYPSGAVGCVSNNYEDKRWRVVCAPPDVSFDTRDAAAKAEYMAVQVLKWVTAMHAEGNTVEHFPSSWKETPACSS